MPQRHQKGDYTLTFPSSFHKESQGLLRFGAGMRSTLQRKRKCARFTCFRREDSQKYLKERRWCCSMMFARSVIHSTKGKHSREHSFDQSALKKLTEELSRTKKVIRRTRF